MLACGSPSSLSTISAVFSLISSAVDMGVRCNILWHDAGITALQPRNTIQNEVFVHNAHLLEGRHISGSKRVPRRPDVRSQPILDGLIIFRAILKVFSFVVASDPIPLIILLEIDMNSFDPSAKRRCPDSSSPDAPHPRIPPLGTTTSRSASFGCFDVLIDDCCSTFRC